MFHPTEPRVIGPIASAPGARFRVLSALAGTDAPGARCRSDARRGPGWSRAAPLRRPPNPRRDCLQPPFPSPITLSSAVALLVAVGEILAKLLLGDGLAMDLV